MTVQEALSFAVSALAPREIETPRLDAQIILSWILKVDRAFLAREPDHVITSRQQTIFLKAVELRQLRRPVPYITGESYFFGHRFKINRAVLIPRPETEHLVDAVRDICAAIERPLIAEVGTGSGCVAISIALAVPDAMVTSIDISPLALLIARKNVVIHNVRARVELLEGSLLEPLANGQKVDIVVSNPPYVTVAQTADLQPEVRDYEPVLALSGLDGASGPDGTEVHRTLLKTAHSVLKSNGWVILEVGMGQAKVVLDYAKHYGYYNLSTITDYSGVERVVVAQAPVA